MKTFKVLSALLSYPSQGLIDAAPEFPAILDADKVVPAASRDALDLLIGEIAVGELYDLQERYGLLFDRSKTLALHLFEHVHGESRDRGQAMVDLKAMYEALGVTPDREVVTYCQGGYRAAHTYLALRLAGFPRVRNYTGSWKEWGDREHLPIERPGRQRTAP